MTSVRGSEVPTRRLLVVAFHFPPFAGSSGVQRTLRFVQHLPRLGWEPIVLTAQPRAYDHVRPDLLREIPAGVVVERAFALDAARQLAFRGRYPAWLARPDRWMTWRPDAVRRGRRLVRALRPDAIFSTYPTATAHSVGAALATWSGLPWIADFRDPMAQDGYPEDPRTWRSFKRIEERVFAQAAACTFTTPSAAADYRARYPDSAARVEVIENGYDEEAFLRAERDPQAGVPLQPGVATLLHSGVVYPSERDPTQLFAALALLKRDGIDGKQLRVRFRAPGHEALLARLASAQGVADMVDILPAVPYHEALVEMLRADGLLVMQAANCNAQIPAKLYEYARAGRPIVALTDPAGDTARALAGLGVAVTASLDSKTAIAPLLAGWARSEIESLLPQRAPARACSRESRAAGLAALLDVAAAASTSPALAAH